MKGLADKSARPFSVTEALRKNGTMVFSAFDPLPSTRRTFAPAREEPPKRSERPELAAWPA
jgi:hypothetical protein